MGCIFKVKEFHVTVVWLFGLTPKKNIAAEDYSLNTDRHILTVVFIDKLLPSVNICFGKHG